MSVGIAETAMPSEVDPGDNGMVLVALSVPGMEGFHIEVSQRALDKFLFDFNPTADTRVVIVKALHAALAQMLYDHVEIEMSTEFDESDADTYQRQIDASEARMSLADRAIDALEVTQMLAVKSFFAKA